MLKTWAPDQKNPFLSYPKLANSPGKDFVVFDEVFFVMIRLRKVILQFLHLFRQSTVTEVQLSHLSQHKFNVKITTLPINCGHWSSEQNT